MLRDRKAERQLEEEKPASLCSGTCACKGKGRAQRCFLPAAQVLRPPHPTPQVTHPTLSSNVNTLLAQPRALGQGGGGDVARQEQAGALPPPTQRAGACWRDCFTRCHGKYFPSCQPGGPVGLKRSLPAAASHGGSHALLPGGQDRSVAPSPVWGLPTAPLTPAGPCPGLLVFGALAGTAVSGFSPGLAVLPLLAAHPHHWRPSSWHHKHTSARHGHEP